MKGLILLSVVSLVALNLARAAADHGHKIPPPPKGYDVPKKHAAVPRKQKRTVRKPASKSRRGAK